MLYAASHLRGPSLLSVDHFHFALDILVFDAELSPDENHGAGAGAVGAGECEPSAWAVGAAVCCISRRSARAFIPALYSRRPRCVTELPRARPFSTYTRGNTACPPIHARCCCGIRWASRGCGSPPLHVEERFRNSQWVSSLPPFLSPSFHPKLVFCYRLFFWLVGQLFGLEAVNDSGF